MTCTRLSSVLFFLAVELLLSSFSISQSRGLEDPAGALPPAIPKREVRAAWVVTLRGQNWPKSFDPGEQRQALITIFQSMKSANLNTIVLQVRARGDLLYPSRYEPWAQSLTGTLGEASTYDPLRFAVEEAHKLGMELHAWWNVVRVADGSDPPPLVVPQHIVNAHRDWVKMWVNRDRNGRPTSTEWWLDMGIPEVRSYLIGVVMEMVRNYDIDGVHFDYLRYPGPEFDDEKTYARYGDGTPKDEWRRENINKFVRAVYDSIISVKPMLKVGSTPIGVYKNLPGAEGWQAYVNLFQDAHEWLAEGKQDYVVPQIYWGTAGNPKFNVLVRDWQENSHGRHVYIGVGAYKPAVLKELPALIDTTRQAGALGNCFFTFDEINAAGVFADRYRYRALIPPMSWKDSIPPNPPTNLTAFEENAGRCYLRWTPPSPAVDGDNARRFAIYRFITGEGDTDDPSNLLTVVGGEQSSYIDEISRPASVRYRYLITALDKGNVESTASNEAAVMITQLVALARSFQPVHMLAQNSPNPFSEFSFIAYELTATANVRLDISNNQGEDVATLVNGLQGAGRYVVMLDGEKFKPGKYRYTLTADGFSETRSMQVSR
jgi:uncharacterized lipoprotein YddW (UPF0748 family)